MRLKTRKALLYVSLATLYVSAVGAMCNYIYHAGEGEQAASNRAQMAKKPCRNTAFAEANSRPGCPRKSTRLANDSRYVYD